MRDFPEQLDRRYLERSTPGPLACELEVDGQRFAGAVVDASPEGIFVQTDAAPALGAEIRIKLRDPSGPCAYAHALVARRVVVARSLTGLSTGGVGLHIPKPSHACRYLLSGVWPRRRNVPATAPLRPDERFRFRILGKQTDGPGLRDLVVGGRSADDARDRALAYLGHGWSIVDVRPA